MAQEKRKRGAGTSKERERERESTDHKGLRFSVRSLKGEVTCGLLLRVELYTIDAIGTTKFNLPVRSNAPEL